MTKNILVAVVMLFAVASSTGADTENDRPKCEGIRDARKRLVCYDSAAKQSKSTADAEAAKQQAEAERLTKEKEQKIAQEKERAALEKEKALAAANVALRAIKRFESRLATGISYRDYSAPLAEANFEVREFSQSSAGNVLPDVRQALNSAIEHYLFAGNVWSQKFSARRTYDYLSRFEAPEIYDRLISSYSLSVYRDLGILYDAALKVIWIEASFEIGKTSLILKHGGEIPKNEISKVTQEQDGDRPVERKSAEFGSVEGIIRPGGHCLKTTDCANGLPCINNACGYSAFDQGSSPSPALQPKKFGWVEGIIKAGGYCLKSNDCANGLSCVDDACK